MENYGKKDLPNLTKQDVLVRMADQSKAMMKGGATKEQMKELYQAVRANPVLDKQLFQKKWQNAWRPLMNQDDFVENVIRSNIRDSILQNARDLLLSPDNELGGNQFDKLDDLAPWYESLGEREKQLVQLLLRETIDFSVWRFLLMFNYPSIGEIREQQGHLELFYVSATGERTMISGDFENLEMMHEMYHSTPDFPDWIFRKWSADDLIS